MQSFANSANGSLIIDLLLVLLETLVMLESLGCLILGVEGRAAVAGQGVENQDEGGLGSADGVGALVFFVSAKIFGEGVLAYLRNTYSQYNVTKLLASVS